MTTDLLLTLEQSPTEWPRKTSSAPHTELCPESVVVEVCGVQRFSTLRDAWNDLTLRACEPNPFMDPDVLAAAAGGEGADEAPVLLAWSGHRLVGVWAFRRTSPQLRLPIAVLATPIRNLTHNATPVIDRDRVEPVLSAMLDAIHRAPRLPSLLRIEMMNDGGPAMAALLSVLAARRRPPVVLWRGVRPMLSCTTEPTAYFARTMSGGRRRKLGQLRRRLSARGNLTLDVHRDRVAVVEAAERFVKLEASGWKAKSGASECERIRYRDFIRNAVTALADHGSVEIWEFSLVGVAISMALILRHLSGAYDWKIAFDERQRDCSPGVLLAQDYTTAFLRDPKVDFADSCATTDAGVLGTLWDGRQPMVSLIADARPGGSLAFTFWAGFEIGSRKPRNFIQSACEMIRWRLRRQNTAADATAKS